MMIPAPKVDPRRAQDVFVQISALLPKYVDRWPESPPQGAAKALTGVFARYCELIVERLNKLPYKNLLAFLDLLGVSLAPPQPARVPLTFYLAPNRPTGAVIPAFSQAAALPGKGETQPVVFETERELVVSPALLDSLWILDAPRDRYSDYDDLLDQTPLPPPVLKLSDGEVLERLQLNLTGKKPTPEEAAAFAAETAPDKRSRLLERLIAGGVPIFRGSQPIEHVLYVGLPSEPSAPVWSALRLNIALESDLAALPGVLHWEIWDGHSGFPLTPASDGTQRLTRSGEVVFGNILAPPLVAVDKRRWLRLRWTSPDGELPKALPVIKAIAITVATTEQGAPVDLAFSNSLPLDLSKDFFPLGERPKFGDTFYLSSPIFSAPEAVVTLKIQIANPAAGGPQTPIPPVKANAVVLKWEFWDGTGWRELGTSESLATRMRIARVGEPVFTDTTQTFTASGEVTFKFPSAPQPVVVNKQSKTWIRVRLVSGDYGRELRYEQEPARGAVITPASFAPPVIHSIEVDQSLTLIGPPPAILIYNNFNYRAIMGPPISPFAPFELGRDPQASCYLGFQSGGRAFPSRSMSIYFGVENSGEAPDAARPPVIWEYWNGKAWTAWTVRDDTRGLRSSGVIRFLAPPDFSATPLFGRDRFWLRARRVEPIEPMLKRVLLNTTMAAQTQTTLGEVLGSSSGKPGQTFRTARTPVLEGQQLEVLELAVPSSAEREIIEREEGIDAITELPSTVAMQPSRAWVRWHEVVNFEGSGPRDRHYAVNRPSGVITFGDAVNGMAPPVLTANIRMARYQTGGGSVGNKPAGSIMQLKTTIPYVQGVMNFEAADGGADTEQPEDILERETHRIRHRGRAVTPEDFEDLALLASNEVARALCIPLRDLRSDRMAKVLAPGAISLIVVPRWSDGAAAPAPPSAELLERLRSYLDSRRFTGAKLMLLAPEYMRIDVNVEITVADVDTAGDVELGVTRALQNYLNPLTGFEGAGWDFGKLPHRSDLYSFIESLPGVEHVRSLEMKAVGDLPDTEQTGRFLSRCGEIRVSTTLEK